MADQQSEEQRFRKGIQEMIRRVPDSVKSGSYQRSIAFKEACDKAQKALKGRGGFARLQQAHNNLAVFY